MLLVGVGLVAVLAIVAIALLLRDDDAPVRTSHGATTPSEADATAPATPAFRFAKATRKLVPTSPRRIKRRQREASERAAKAATAILTDYYAEGFLDPANWQQGSYTDAFGDFATGAREQAETRAGLLTAGPRAGDRYEQILPVSGRLFTRILLDRAGKPTLLWSAVRFSAAALGPEPVTLRSTAQFFFERIGGSWKIVSFHVTRNDVPRKAA
jgi:hypothetical protein